MNQHRRDFLQHAALALPLTRWLAAQPPTVRRLERIGLELYSVRGAMRRDPEGTLAAVRAIGYTDVELLWTFDHFGRSVSQVRSTLESLGLVASSAHIAPELLLGDWRGALETARTLGHRLLAVPSLPAETRNSLEAWRRWADHFNTAGAVAREAGVQLAFHNEPDHQRLVDGQVPLELFVERLDVRYAAVQLDTGNMTMGGGDPMAFLRRHAHRVISLHIKDVRPDRRADTALGRGIVDLRGVLAAVPAIERVWCYVEQEGASDTVDAARADWEYLSRLEF